MIRLAFRIFVTFVLVIARMLSPRPVFVRPPGVYDAQ
jgi:hypothetical protein